MGEKLLSLDSPMNPVGSETHVPRRATSPDKEMTFKTLKEGAEESYTKNIFKGTKVFKGVVLKVESSREALAEIRQRSFLDGSGEPPSTFLAARVRIPEVHCHIPKPKIVPAPTGEEEAAKIKQHPLFLVRKSEVDSLNAGDIVEVTFLQGPDAGKQVDGKIISKSQTAQVTVGEGDDADQVKRVFTDLSPSEVSQLATVGDSSLPGPRMEPAERAIRRNVLPGTYVFEHSPLRGAFRVSGEFGNRTRNDGTGMRLHRGIDIAVRDEPIYSTFKGRLFIEGSNDGTGGWILRLVATEEPYASAGIVVRYLHVNNRLLSNLNNTIVDANTRIGTSGNTGRSSEGMGYSYHLHFEVLQDGEARNPREFLPLSSFAEGSEPQGMGVLDPSREEEDIGVGVFE
jgi:murein DD-endopeptidase MepM/ murein hydrolase activator NlpD